MVKAAIKRSAEREELAAAIDGAAEAANAVENARAAIARANDLIASAYDTHAEAAEKLAQAKEDRATLIIAAATTGADVSQDKVAAREARILEAEAADDLESARSALEAVKAALGDPEDEFERSQKKLKSCIDAVIVGEADRLIAETTELARPLAEKVAVLRFLVSRLDFFNHRETLERLNRFQAGFRLPDHIANQAGIGADAWREACEAMKLSADAELPK